MTSTAAAVRAMPPLKELPANVTSYTLVASSDLDKALDTTKGVNRGAGTPLAKMGGRPANIDSRPAMSFGRPARHEVGRPPRACLVFTVADTFTFPSSNDWEGAPIGHANTPNDGGPHSEEGDCPVKPGGAFRQ
jgi:hypothetical protein